MQEMECACASTGTGMKWKKCRHNQNKVILECGHHPQDAIFEVDDGEVEEDQVFELDRVRIDTTCLKKPIVKIEFSSLIVFEAEDEEGDEHEVEVDLLFKLNRICNGFEETIQTWLLKEYDLRMTL